MYGHINFLQPVSVKFQTFFCQTRQPVPAITSTARDDTRFQVRARSQSPIASRGIRNVFNFLFCIIANNFLTSFLLDVLKKCQPPIGGPLFFSLKLQEIKED